MHIDDILANLAEPPSSAPPLFREELIFRLSMWMQCPADAPAAAFGVFSCVLRYVTARCGEQPVNAWDPDSANLFHRNLPIDVLKKVFSQSYDWAAPELPSLRREFAYGLDDVDAITEATNIFIWYNPTSGNRLDSASLNKIHSHFFRRRKIEGRYYMGIKAFRRLWNKYNNAAGLLYVNKYVLGNLLLLDPTDANFMGDVSILASDCDRLQLALSHARWVDETLAEKLHDNAAKRLRPVTYPEMLVAAPPPPQSLPRGTVSALRRASAMQVGRKHQL